MTMRQPAVCEFLRSGGTTDDLLKRYGVVSKRHRAHPNLVLLKYNQIASPMHESIVQECRGIVLDEADDWTVVSRAFNKFFNHGEGHAAEIDWATARVQEKLDGSLCVLYPYAGAWYVATTGTPDGSGDVNGHGLRFSDYFRNTLENQGGAPSVQSNASDYCFFFELTGPINRIVVVHSEPSLTLLGARRRDTWAEVHPSAVAHFFPGVPVVREFGLQSVDEIAASFAEMSPLSQEGYVVVDAAFRRIKVKHPGYVALHHAKDGLSQRAFVEIARSGETPEVIAAFPELAPQLEETKSRFGALVSEVANDFERIRHIETQKDFAIAATKTRCSSALFSLRAGKASTPAEFFAGIHIDQLMKMLGYKNTPAQEAA
jgi:hypothetical protein